MKFTTAFTVFLSLATAESRYVRSRYIKKEQKCNLWSTLSKAEKKSKSRRHSSKYSFNRISTFQSCLNVEANCNTDTEAVAEIVTASVDGLTLVYTDSETKSVGFVDIVDPSNPFPLGSIGVGGEPTSISTWGDYAIVAVNTSENYVNTSGKLMAINIATQSVTNQWDLGGQPDSVAVSKDGKYIVIAIENERDEDLGEGIPPQMPEGFIVVIKTFGSTNLDIWEPHTVDITGLSGVEIPEDPEPEFVSINENNMAVVTLQENNALLLLDLETLEVSSSFSAGTVDLEGIDTEEEGIIDQTSSLTSIPREPDGVVFIGKNHFVTADEGDMNGGSRGFTVWDVCGNVVYNSGNFMDRYAASIGHYPEERSGNKGVEPENAAFGRYMGTDFLFVNAERANMIFVYDVTNPSNPEFVQALPANIGPEGGLTLPDRNLYVVANEKDERGQVRAGLTIYRYGKQNQQYPSLQSVNNKETGAPIPFAALSGLSPDPKDKNVLYAVEDSFFASSRFFKIKTSKSGKPSKLVEAIQMNDNDGVFASFIPDGGFGGDGTNDFNTEKLQNLINNDLTVNLDSEGIAAVGNGDFYIASEGSGTIDESSRPIKSLNFIFKVNNEGTIKQVLSLPAEWNAKQVRFGFEGVAYDPDKNILVAVTQRAWGSDPHPAIHMFDVDSGTHIGYGFYALDSVASQNGGWVGLSDITYVRDGTFYILERDNQGDIDAAIKKIYAININDYTFDGHIFEKTLVKDILHITDAIGTTPFEKYEGLAYTNNGVWIVNDNDGVDDARGEIQLMNIGDF